MNKGFVVIASILILASGGAALSTDTLVDLSCQASMIAGFNPLCVPIVYDDIIEGSPDDVQDDIYTKVSIINDGRDQIITETNSQLDQMFGIGMAEGKVSAIESLNNDSSKSKAKQEAGTEIDQFYASQQERLINYRNREVIKFNETLNRLDGTTGLTYGDIMRFSQEVGGTTGIDDGSSSATAGEFIIDSQNVTLLDGDEKEVLTVYWKDTDTANYGASQDANRSAYITDPAFSSSPAGVEVQSTNGNWTFHLNPTPYDGAWSNVSGKRSQAYNNVLDIVDQIYSSYVSGAVSTDDVLGSLELLKTSATSYEDTGYYAYKAVSLEQAGIPTADGYGFKIKWNASGVNKTRWGQLFAPSGSFTNDTLEVNETYDASGSLVQFVHSTPSGKAVTSELDGNFTVLEMENTRNGTSVNSTKLQSIELHTNGVSDLQEQLKQIREAQDEILSGNAGGGASSGGGWQLPFGLGSIPVPTAEQTGIGAVAIVVLLLLVGA